MTESEDKLETGGYDTTINVIGGMKDCSDIFRAIDSYFCEDESVSDLIRGRNEFNLRTERSRTRVERAVKRAFLHFHNQDHKELIQKIFQSKMSLPERELVLFWQLSLNNRLFRDISSQVYIKAYFSGRAGVSKEDVTAYLKELVTHNKGLSWSESTIHTLSTKYLNLMTKLTFLEGARTKSFKHIKPTSEALIIFLYFAKLDDPQATDILKNEMLPFSFVAREDVQERLKKLSLQGFFDMNVTGVALNIELKHSYKGICDVLYNRP